MLKGHALLLYGQSKLFEALKQDYTNQTMRVHGENVCKKQSHTKAYLGPCQISKYLGWSGFAKMVSS